MINQNLKSTITPYFGILIVGAIALFLFGSIEYNAFRFSNFDLKHYRAMADVAPFLNTDIPQPFVYRILGPWLAGLFPTREVH